MHCLIGVRAKRRCQQIELSLIRTSGAGHEVSKSELKVAEVGNNGTSPDRHWEAS